MKPTQPRFMTAALCAGLFLNLSLDAAPGVRVTPLTVSPKGKPGYFPLTPKETGLQPTGHYRKVKGEAVRATGNSGLAVGDFNGDGWPDLFVCGMEQPNALYENLGGSVDGKWKFKEVSAEAGVECKGWRLSGALFADVDGDRDLDLILTSLRDTRNFLFINDGKGKFTESLNIGWAYNHRGGSVGTSMADVDGDGDLDMYVTGFLKKLVTNARHLPDRLYLNDGKGNFRAVADVEERFRDQNNRPIPMPKDPSHEAAFRDVDGDGDPDLYVCADFDWEDRFWINDGKGNFSLIEPIALRHTSQFSMGIDFTDLNRDGHLDFITVDMLSRSHLRRKTQMGFMSATEVSIGLIENRPQIMQNTLHLGRGDGTWTEIAQYAGLKASEWSWGVAFTDVDLDGYEDLIVASGMIRDYMDADVIAENIRSRQAKTPAGIVQSSMLFPELPTLNMAYRNQGDLTFDFKSLDWFMTSEDREKIRKKKDVERTMDKYRAVSGGLAQADFDGDGDLDLIFNNIGPLEIYRNEATAPRVAVRLIGNGKNTQAIGAKVRLRGGPGGSGAKPLEQEVICGAGYASGSETLLVFGTGEASEKELELEIIWRNRSQLDRRVIKSVKPNHLYTITQGPDDPYVPPVPKVVAPIFRDELDQLAVPHPKKPNALAWLSHGEAPFDDFAYQSLLPNRLSQLGPGVGWMDLNSDGFEDLVIAAGAHQNMLIYYGQAGGKFKFGLGPRLDLDRTGVVSWTAKAGERPNLIAGISNYEARRAFNRAPARAFGFSAQDTELSVEFSLPSQKHNAGPIALADVDGDGDLDLFLGGRSVPARYPEPADSHLFLNDNGILKPDPANAKALSKLGLVSGAVFGDLDGDGDADLVLALEWGPVTVLRNDAGKFTNATKKLGLDTHRGWWNSVTLGDFDGDGRLDIAAGNWGLNSKYEGSYSKDQPLRVRYSDFDNNGVLDIVECHFDKQTGMMVPERGRDCTTRAMPFIGQHNPEFRVFGSRSLDEVYQGKLKNVPELTANTLAHAVFLNRDGKFEPRLLPPEAQFAPVFGINVADFDGDGNEDLFIAQNFFASQNETPRSDGGRSLLLKGDGKGGFQPVNGRVSGLRIYGEQRGSAVADYNHDGRPDLVVTQNGSLTRLYRNLLARPGLRVKVNAGPANPTGVGAIVRMKFSEGKIGPARLITAGSGYWSQDSAVQVLATPAPPTHMETTWPNGETTSTVIAPGAKEISIGRGGRLIPAK